MNILNVQAGSNFNWTAFFVFIDNFGEIINLWVIVLPYATWTAAGVVWNIYMNISANNWWALGNVYLVLSTLFGLF